MRALVVPQAPSIDSSNLKCKLCTRSPPAGPKPKSHVTSSGFIGVNASIRRHYLYIRVRWIPSYS